MKSSTQRVLDFSLELNWANVPINVQHQAKRCLLDTYGALLAGTATPLAKLTAKIARDYFGGGICTILADGGTASSIGASFANGFASNALDVEHGYRPSQGRPGDCLISVLLPSMQTMPAPPDGRRFLESLLIGYEVSVRAGMLRNVNPAKVYTSGAWGAVGATAGGGHLLSLDPRTLLEALGATDYHGPIGLIMQGVATPCMAKDGIGWGSVVAMSSIVMAQNGFTAPEPEFEAIPGIMDDLGSNWRCLGLYFKPFCCCRWAQASITGALNLMKEHKLSHQDIAGITIRTFKNAAALSREHPTDTEHAQYNLSYPIAVAIYDGKISGAQVLPPRLADPEVLRLADLVQVELAEEFEREFPAKTFSETRLTMKDGQVYSSGPLEPLWEAAAPPTDDELNAKFREMAGPILGDRETERLADCVWKAEDLPSALDLVPRVRKQ